MVLLIGGKPVGERETYAIYMELMKDTEPKL